MRTEQIRKIFHPFTKIPGVRKLLKPLYSKLIYEPARKKEIQAFQSHALSVLEEFDIIMKKYDTPYCLFWGSLIGAVRERGFIKHDFDIDVAIWYSDYEDTIKDALISNGFKHKQRFLVDGGKNGMEDTFEKNGVAIDIFYFYEDIGDKAYCCSFNYINGEVTWEDCFKKYGTVDTYKFYFDLPKTFIYTPFETIHLPIPENYDQILRSHYGPGYLVPDPSWKGNLPHKNKFENCKVSYIHY